MDKAETFCSALIRLLALFDFSALSLALNHRSINSLKM